MYIFFTSDLSYKRLHFSTLGFKFSLQILHSCFKFHQCHGALCCAVIIWYLQPCICPEWVSYVMINCPCSLSSLCHYWVDLTLLKTGFWISIMLAYECKARQKRNWHSDPVFVYSHFHHLVWEGTWSYWPLFSILFCGHLRSIWSLMSSSCWQHVRYTVQYIATICITTIIISYVFFFLEDVWSDYCHNKCLSHGDGSKMAS